MRWQKTALVILAHSFLLPHPCVSYAKTLNVPKEFKSISNALQSAVSGDEIIVASGTYKEHITLKEGVTLRSQGSEQERSNFTSAARTIIQATGEKKQGILGAENAILDGFTLQALKAKFETESEEYGVLINATKTTITNCIIASLPYTAIKINGSDSKKSATIKNNQIYDNKGNGIDCDQAALAHIENNKIYQNLKSGIENSQQAKPFIIGNVIYDNGIDGIMNTFAQPTITKNEIRENGLNGIGLQKSSNGQIDNNTISQNQQAGIGVRSNAEAKISGNTISGNMIGVGLIDIKEATIESNKINGNNIGIGLIRCTGGKVILRKNSLGRNMIIPISPNMGCEVIEKGNSF